MVVDQGDTLGIGQVSLEEGLQFWVVGKVFFELLEDRSELLSEDVGSSSEVA